MEDKDIPTYVASLWQPTTDPVQVAMLGKLVEELGECAAVVSRCLVQGIEETAPVTGKPNRQWLEDEIADVMSMFDRVMVHFTLDPKRICERRMAKYDFTSKWFGKLREERDREHHG